MKRISCRRVVWHVCQVAARGFRTAWAILKTAAGRFAASHSPEAAAGLAFYAMFALFPLLLFLIVFGSSVLESEEAQGRILALVSEVLPTSQDLVIENVRQVLRLRGTVGLFAGLSLLWSSSGFFMIMARQINRVWPDTAARKAIERRIVALGIVGGLGILLALWLTLSVAIVPHIPSPLLAKWRALRPLVWPIMATGLTWGIPILFLLFTYRAVPKRRVGWFEALCGALVATIAWRGATHAFAWYLGSGLSKYQLVYGSLSSIIVLMVWLYLCGQILLFGASLCAAIAMYRHAGNRDLARKQPN